MSRFGGRAGRSREVLAFACAIAFALIFAGPATAQSGRAVDAPDSAAATAAAGTAGSDTAMTATANAAAMPATTSSNSSPASSASGTARRAAGIAASSPAAPVAGASIAAAPRTAARPRDDLGVDFRLFPATAAGETAGAVRIVLGLTLLAIVPALLVCATAFLRIVIVLAMLRHAIGMPETPPNTAVIGLALFLTLFTMAPVLQTLNRDALQPFVAGDIGAEAAYAAASRPLREFMARQTREQDIALMVDLSKAPRPQTLDDVGNVQLVPAFMLSELRAAFQIGFVVFLPFLLIDLIVSSVLMALGMMMMPPITVALPLKLLMFILVDGWSLILKALVGSFH